MSDTNFNIAIIDADSLFYKIAYVQPSPALCKKQFDGYLEEIISTTETSDVAVFIKGKNNFRFEVAVDYKGNRKDTIEPEVKDRIEKLYEYARTFCVESDNGEADDYCGIATQLAYDEGKVPVVCHIDKDLDMIPGWHYNFSKKNFYFMSEEDSYAFLMKQVLMGDSTDNIQGIKGLGAKTAEKILNGVPHNLMWSTVVDTYKKKCGSTWELDLYKSANLIYIRMYSDDLKPLTLEELEKKFTWKKQITDTGSLSVQDQPEPMASSILSSDQPEDNTSEERL